MNGYFRAGNLTLHWRYQSRKKWMVLFLKIYSCLVLGCPLECRWIYESRKITLTQFTWMSQHVFDYKAAVWWGFYCTLQNNYYVNKLIISLFVTHAIITPEQVVCYNELPQKLTILPLKEYKKHALTLYHKIMELCTHFLKFTETFYYKFSRYDAVFAQAKWQTFKVQPLSKNKTFFQQSRLTAGRLIFF